MVRARLSVRECQAVAALVAYALGAAAFVVWGASFFVVAGVVLALVAAVLGLDGKRRARRRRRRDTLRRRREAAAARLQPISLQVSSRVSADRPVLIVADASAGVDAPVASEMAVSAARGPMALRR